MKLHVPPNITLSPEEISQWETDVAQMTEDFQQSAPTANSDFEIDLYSRLNASVDLTPFITPMWREHYQHAETQFMNRNMRMLQDSLMQYAFFLSAGGVYQRKQIPFLEGVRSKDLLKHLLREDPWLTPNITNQEYKTSENLVNHLTHLVAFEEETGAQIKDMNRIIEFGGGYGGFARLCRRMNPRHTHIIIDLPIFLAIQTFYLKNIFGAEMINTLIGPDAKIEPHKINLIAIGSPHIQQITNAKNDLFVATWSLSEANEFTQAYVSSRNYFQADHLLLGYRHYDQVNPRQPCSDTLRETSGYTVIYRGETFWSQLNHYFFCKAKGAYQ